MERTLALVLNEQGDKHLILETMDKNAMDEYIAFNFENADDLRNKYASKISAFLNDNTSYMYYRSSNSSYRNGQIILVNGSTNFNRDNRIRILYKKDLVTAKDVFKTPMVKDALNRLNQVGYVSRNFGKMKNLAIGSKVSFSGDVHKPENFDKFVNERKYDTNLYDKIRVAISIYDEKRKGTNLPTRDRLYKDYIASLGQLSFVPDNNNELHLEEVADERADFITVNGVKYDADDRVLFDNDDLMYADKNYKVDGIDEGFTR